MQQIVSSLWVKGDLTKVERICMASALYFGHKYKLYTYSPITNCPSGVELCDANMILPESMIFQYGSLSGGGRGSFAGFSNLFRYTLLLKKAGVWVDTDILFLRPLDNFANYLFGFQDSTIINNAVLGIQEDKVGLLESLVDVALNPFRIYEWDTYKVVLKKIYARIFLGGGLGNVPWGTTGPKALTGLVNKKKLTSFARPSKSFYPIAQDCWAELIVPEKIDAILQDEEIKLVHLWNEFMRRDNFDKNGSWPETSILGWAERKFKDYMF